MTHHHSTHVENNTDHRLKQHTMAQSASRLRSCYRQMLRELPLREIATASSKPSLLQRQIREYIAAPASADRPLESHIAAMHQFVQYFKAQRTYLTLLERSLFSSSNHHISKLTQSRYNPGVSMSEEEKIRLTAKRVGMGMPAEWYPKP